jgi:predicted MFS family arabinose efflux permease
LITVMAIGFIGAFLGLPLLTFLPVITTDVFHQDVTFYTRLMTCSGAGAVTGALVVAWLGKSKHLGRLLLLVLALFGTTMVGLAVSRTIYGSGAILFIAGALLVMGFSLATSLTQLLSPPEFRGRVISLYLVAFLGGSPLGSLASGWLITQVGSAPVMLIVNGAALTIVALSLLVRGHGLNDI